MKFRAVQDLQHIQRCPAGFADLADVFLVTGTTRFPAHSQQLAMQSRFIQELLTTTGPFSWQNPLVLDTALRDHTAATVRKFLMAVYLPDSLNLSSADEAWRLYKLADQLECPTILQHCKDYINSSSGAALLTTSSATIEWVLAAHELGLAGLKQQCADHITRDYLDVSDSSQLLQLPQELMLLIMRSMAKQKRHDVEEVMGKMKGKKCQGECQGKWQGKRQGKWLARQK